MTTTTVSTISLSGSPDYSTLQAWENAAPANLVTSDVVWQGVIQLATDVFTGSGSILLMNSGTVDATRYKELTVAADASFADHASPILGFDTSKGAAIDSTTVNAVNCNELYNRIGRVQIRAGTNTALRAVAGELTAVDMILTSDAAPALNLNGVGHTLDNVLVTNKTGGGVAIMTMGGTSSLTARNVTFAKPSDITVATNLISGGVGDVIDFTNCAFFGCTNVQTALLAATYTDCASDDASPPSGVTTVAYVDALFESTLLATGDWRLTSSSPLKDAGSDNGLLFDIFGTARPTGAAFDIGAHEAASGGSGTIPINSNDGVFKALGALGYTGGYNDRLHAFFSDNLGREGALSELQYAYIKANGRLI